MTTPAMARGRLYFMVVSLFPRSGVREEAADCKFVRQIIMVPSILQERR